MRKIADNRPDGARAHGAERRASAATTAPKAAPKKVIVANRSFTGPTAQADRWGNLQVTIVVKKTTTTTGGEDDRQAPDHVDQGARLPGPHRPLACTSANNALPILDPGGAQGAERAHLHRLGRDLHERRVRALAAGRDHEGEGVVTAALPGLRRVEHDHGHADRDRRARRRTPSERSARRGLRRVPRGRRALQHLPATTARSCASTAASWQLARRAPRRARDPRALRASCARETRGFFDVRAASPGDRSTRRASSRAGRVDRVAAHPRRAAGCATSPSAPAATSSCAAAALPDDCWRVGHPAPDDRRQARQGRRRERPRDRDVRRLRARRPRRRSAHAPAADAASSRSRSPGPSSRRADAYATAAFAMGASGPGLDGAAARATRR